MNDIYVLEYFIVRKCFIQETIEQRSDIFKHSLGRFIAVELFRLKSNWSVGRERGGVVDDDVGTTVGDFIRDRYIPFIRYAERSY